MCNMPGAMLELGTADSTWKRQRRLGGAFQLGMRACVRVLQVDEGGKETQAEGTGCAKDRGQERA